MSGHHNPPMADKADKINTSLSIFDNHRNWRFFNCPLTPLFSWLLTLILVVNSACVFFRCWSYLSKRTDHVWENSIGKLLFWRGETSRYVTIIHHCVARCLLWPRSYQAVQWTESRCPEWHRAAWNNLTTIGSMGLAYLLTWMLDFYGTCRKIIPYNTHTWNLPFVWLSTSSGLKCRNGTFFCLGGERVWRGSAGVATCLSSTW